MKTNLPCLLLVLISVSQFAQAKNSKKWVSLFNGNNLDGWVVQSNPDDRLKHFWTVENGVIKADSSGSKQHDYIWLLSEKEYQDFELKLKFAAYRASKGNSGIQIRSRYDTDESWLDGPQIDIHTPNPYRTGMMWDETRGARRWIYPDLPKGTWVKKEMAVSAPEFYYSDDALKWNEMRVLVKGYKVKAWLNSALATDFDGERILTSELHKKYNVGEKGHIALQIHKKQELKILFKDIYIKE